jgi:hypothetical protein
LSVHAIGSVMSRVMIGHMCFPSSILAIV